MSLRSLRKLQEKQIEKSYNEVSDDQNDESSLYDNEKEENLIPVKACNRFDLLLGGSPSESEAKEDDGLTEIGDEVGNRNELSKNHDKSNIIINPSGVRKKRRKKKRKAHSTKHPAASSEDQLDTEYDEVEKSVREVNAMLGEAKYHLEQTKDSEEKSGRSLLSVEHKHLNPQNEMKRIFGARVVQANEINRKRNHRTTSGSSRVGRGTWIVQGQTHWGQHSKPGISMVLLESTASYHTFKFQHSSVYQQAQFKFLEAVESLNPDNILALLHSEPFHVDTLLQVSEIFRLADDSAMSSQLIERAIFVLESVGHPLFNVTTGNCRLQYKQQENRCFFIALFRHILNVGMKGCYRTALELCKLLLSLSPDDDPMAVSLMLDFYALRSQEYAWLASLYDLYEPTKNLSMLPNFSFSVPLALFHLAASESSASQLIASNEKQERGRHQYLNYTGSSKELKDRADEMLQRAIIMFPGVVKPLLDKCNIQPDINIDSHPYFGIKAQTSMNKGLSQIVNLYVGRNYHVWKESDVMIWLEENFRKALARVDSEDPLVIESEEKRRLRYQGTPTAIYRHIIIAEVKDATAALPPSLSNSPVMSYDPLPPPDSVCDYTRPKPPSRPASSSSSILASFFRGLLPNYDPNAPPEQEEEEGAAGGGDELDTARAELRASVNTLLEAMRNLFSNINLTEPAGEEADNSQSEDEENHQWE